MNPDVRILREWCYSEEISLWKLINSPKVNIQVPLVWFWNLENAERQCDISELPCLNLVYLWSTLNSMVKSHTLNRPLSQAWLIDNFDLDVGLASQFSLDVLSDGHGCASSVLVWGSFYYISPWGLEIFPDEAIYWSHHIWGLKIIFLVSHMTHGMLAKGLSYIKSNRVGLDNVLKGKSIWRL
jgi:hypothetical protein